MPIVVYALRFADGTIYVGLTKDFARRAEEHERRQSPSTRRFKGEFQCIYQAAFETYMDARKHEKYLKSGAGRKYLISLVGHQGVPTPQALPR